jgi:hypothetical protein
LRVLEILIVLLFAKMLIVGLFTVGPTEEETDELVAAVGEFAIVDELIEIVDCDVLVVAIGVGALNDDGGDCAGPNAAVAREEASEEDGEGVGEVLGVVGLLLVCVGVVLEGIEDGREGPVSRE